MVEATQRIDPSKRSFGVDSTPKLLFKGSTLWVASTIFYPRLGRSMLATQKKRSCLDGVEKEKTNFAAFEEKFGGLWVDATLFCTAPAMPWLQAADLLNGEQMKRVNGSKGTKISRFVSF